MREYKAPEKTPNTSWNKLFLAGTIDMGESIDWQKNVKDSLENEEIIIYNPRRDDWDSTWEQNLDNPNFKEQVFWELDHLDKADIILMNFLETSKSVISLLELGLYADSGKMIVVCPRGFYRRGNVEAVCIKYSIPLYDTINDAIEVIKSKL